MKTLFTNIPTEALRSLVAIAETGSLVQAANRVGLSQPALSAQMSRLQNLIGGPLVSRTANGTKLTELGRLALVHARQLLSVHDQLLRLRGNATNGASLRLGLDAWLLEPVLKIEFNAAKDNVFIIVDRPGEICRRLIEGHVDMACVLLSNIDIEVSQFVVERRHIPLAWVRSKCFLPEASQPIPIISLRDDENAIAMLQRWSYPYRIVLQGADHHSSLVALRAGLGVYAAPVGLLSSDIVLAREVELPELPPLEACICARPGLDRPSTKAIGSSLVRALSALHGEVSS